MVDNMDPTARQLFAIFNSQGIHQHDQVSAFQVRKGVQVSEVLPAILSSERGEESDMVS